MGGAWLTSTCPLPMAAQCPPCGLLPHTLDVAVEPEDGPDRVTCVLRRGPWVVRLCSTFYPKTRPATTPFLAATAAPSSASTSGNVGAGVDPPARGGSGTSRSTSASR